MVPVHIKSRGLWYQYILTREDYGTSTYQQQLPINIYYAAKWPTCPWCMVQRSTYSRSVRQTLSLHWFQQRDGKLHLLPQPLSLMQFLRSDACISSTASTGGVIPTFGEKINFVTGRIFSFTTREGGGIGFSSTVRDVSHHWYKGLFLFMDW